MRYNIFAFLISMFQRKSEWFSGQVLGSWGYEKLFSFFCMSKLLKRGKMNFMYTDLFSYLFFFTTEKPQGHGYGQGQKGQGQRGQRMAPAIHTVREEPDMPDSQVIVCIQTAHRIT